MQKKEISKNKMDYINRYGKENYDKTLIVFKKEDELKKKSMEYCKKNDTTLSQLICKLLWKELRKK